MKKFLLWAAIAAAGAVQAPVSAGMSYSCYFDATNEPMLGGGSITVVADNRAEAEQKARAKILELRGSNTVIKSLKCE